MIGVCAGLQVGRGGGGAADRWPVRADKVKRHESFLRLLCQEIVLMVISDV